MSWEDRVMLFVGYKIENGMKSNSVKSYVSAIKRTLTDDGYQWNDNKILLGSLTRACRLINDRVHTRLPIRISLLELLLFEVQRHFIAESQLYLERMYKALFVMGYYGMMRVGELTWMCSGHAVKACNVHAAMNKNKLMIVLYTSKTHGAESRPQKIKITANDKADSMKNSFKTRNFCPFKLVNDYISARGPYQEDYEQFFVFKDGSNVTATHAREVLKLALDKLGLDKFLYGMHSLRVGRASDLVSEI